ncbi:MAG: HAMP domain-containing histidine kinase [Bacteroidales bacterium]|nr:HAMP domain-containing histidine kinase [Bacteroidales bacterium]
MKFHSFIWLSGIALVILILVQYYFISETFDTKQAQFDSKYKGLARLALYEFENNYFNFEQDSILTLLDDYSYFSMHDLGFAANDRIRDSIQRTIFLEFNDQLNQQSLRNIFLRNYFKKIGEDENIVSKYILREVSLLSFNDEFTIFKDTLRNDEDLLSMGYFINSYNMERNYFRVRYDYFIAFPNRSEQISKEMLLTKTLSITTLIIVFAVFFLTLRNLYIQKRLSELKTDFINNMTHELKTPLSTISVATSSLLKNRDRLDHNRITEISEIIKKQNRHLGKLIDRILDITIWEKDQVHLEPKQVKIKAFLDELTRDFCATNPQVSFHIQYRNIKDDDTFRLDELHMNTVINNLLSNAVKYGGDPPRVELTASKNGMLEIDLADNGKGIPRGEMEHIFNKFFRGKESRKNAIKGLGLGLFYVKKIIDAHQGDITVESIIGKGTKFKIKIPVANEYTAC